MGQGTENGVEDGSILTGQERERYVHTMFDRIAGQYDRLNRMLSLGGDLRWRRTAIQMGGVGPGSHVVDVGTGTGDLYLMLREIVGEAGAVAGIDISEGMLEVARAKSEIRFPDTEHDLRTGNALMTGLPAASVDVALMGWVLRNVADRPTTYGEMLRVLKPGGRFVCIDMSRSGFAPLRWASAIYLGGIMPLVVRLTGGDMTAYRYLSRSTNRFPMKAELAVEMRLAGFEEVAWRSLMMGSIAIHVGRKPQGEEA